MPPKKNVVTEEESGSGSTGGLALSQSETEFLIDCLRFPIGGSVAVSDKYTPYNTSAITLVIYSNQIVSYHMTQSPLTSFESYCVPGEITDNLQIDAKAVAEARGQKSAGSIANRIAALKKKYNFPISTSLAGSPRKVADPTGPVTPSKVTKSRGKGSAKKATKKEEASDEDTEEKVKEGDDEDDDMADEV